MKEDQNHQNTFLMKALNTLVGNIAGNRHDHVSADAAGPDAARPDGDRQTADQINQISDLLYAIRQRTLSQSAAGKDDPLSALSLPRVVDFESLHTRLKTLARRARRVHREDENQVAGFVGELSRTFRELAEEMDRENRDETAVRQDLIVRMFHTLNLMAVVLNSHGRVLYANRAAVRYWRSHDAGGGAWGNMLTGMIAGHLPPRDRASVFFEARGRRWYQIESAPIEWVNDKDAVLYTLMDVTEMKSYEEVLRAAAEKDALTGVYRRETGLKVFQEVMRDKDPEAAYVVSFLDIDNLKVINDRHGHSAGDDAIRGTAEILKNSLRESDIIIRAGGDEFVFILIGGDDQTARELSRRVYSKLEEFNQTKNVPFTLRFSVGMSQASRRPEDVEHLIAVADAEMYKNKRSVEN